MEKSYEDNILRLFPIPKHRARNEWIWVKDQNPRILKGWAKGSNSCQSDLESSKRAARNAKKPLSALLSDWNNYIYSIYLYVLRKVKGTYDKYSWREEIHH